MNLSDAQINALCFPQGFHNSRTLKVLVAKGLITPDRQSRTAAGDMILQSLEEEIKPLRET